jgi:hypothetical protein
MFHRQTTPNAPICTRSPASVGSRTASAYSTDNSPASVITQLSIPDRSPIHQYGGQAILPKTRVQDQVTEPSAAPVRHHKKNASTSNLSFSASYHPYANSRPNSLIRRATSPPRNDASGLSTPASVSIPSPFDAAFHSGVNSPIDFGPVLARRSSVQSVQHSRSSSATGYGHRRSGSGSNLDETIINRYAFPTYRTMPSYVTSVAPAASAYTTTAAPPTLTVNTAMPFNYDTSFDQASQLSEDYNVPDLSPAPAVQYPYTTDMQFDMYSQTITTSTLMEYLTAANPAPNLIRRYANVARNTNGDYWWDVRNLRSWTDFSISKMTSHDDFLKLLNMPVSSLFLPTPARAASHPETEAHLHEIVSSHYATKVNAALQVTMGEGPIMMRPIKPVAGTRQPHFISNYERDYENTIYGEKRGRVVGLVKGYEQWNSGMRSEDPRGQTNYLKGLSHLHRIMREHGARYGFIMTEIELVCVRCGGPPSASSSVDTATVNATGAVPLFGYLELSAPIALSTQGMNAETGEPQFTAGLALWYLHMMARETPLPGTLYWKMDVGGPSAMTRQNAIERDSWIPKVTSSEKREAKRVRGWVFPEDPWNRKERVGRDGARGRKE